MVVWCCVQCWNTQSSLYQVLALAQVCDRVPLPVGVDVAAGAWLDDRPRSRFVEREAIVMSLRHLLGVYLMKLLWSHVRAPA